MDGETWKKISYPVIFTLANINLEPVMKDNTQFVDIALKSHHMEKDCPKKTNKKT